MPGAALYRSQLFKQSVQELAEQAPTHLPQDGCVQAVAQEHRGEGRMLNSTYRASFWGMKPIIYQNDLTGIHLSQRIGIGSKARDAVGEQMNTHDPRPHQQLSITSRPVAKEEGCRLEGRAEVLLLCTKLHSDKSTQRLGFSLPRTETGKQGGGN